MEAVQRVPLRPPHRPYATGTTVITGYGAWDMNLSIIRAVVSCRFAPIADILPAPPLATGSPSDWPSARLYQALLGLRRVEYLRKWRGLFEKPHSCNFAFQNSLYR